MTAHWKSGRLKHWLDLNDSGVWGDDPTGDGDVPVVRSTDISLDGAWDLADVAVRAVNVEDRHRKRLADGDLVVVKSSGSAQHLGKTALVGREVAELGACFANFVQRLRPSSAADPRYVWYLLNSSLAASEMEALGNTTTGLRNLNGDIIGDVTFPGPPLSAQRAIADYLDAETARIDALIEKKLGMVELLEERTMAKIASAFPKDLLMSPDGRPVGFVGSDNVRLGALADVQSGLTLDGGRDVAPNTKPLPYLRVANVQDGSIHLTDVKEVTVPSALARRCALRRGDVLMTEGGDPDKLGRGAVWDGTLEPCLHQNHVFAVRPRGDLDPEYLALLTRTPYARAYFEMTASKTTGIASTSTTKIASFRVPLLPGERQRQIVREVAAALSTIDQTKAKLHQQADLLREHRQAVISEAVSGHTRLAA